MSTRIDELLAAKTTSSFEFFPPKTDEGTRRLAQAVSELHELNPDYVSVTYGANGSSRGRTIEATLMIRQMTDVRVMGHLTCTGQTVDDLKAVIDSYGEAGIDNILAVRGDMPGGAGVPWEPYPGGLKNATELVELIRSRGDFCVGVGAFPDGHSGSFDLDARILADKQEAGASFAITQLFFNPAAFFAMIARARTAGCTLPIVGGIMPVTNIKQLGKFSELSGADIPSSVGRRLLAVSDDPDRVREEGSAIAVELCHKLLAGGAAGLHFFTQNRSLATREILSTLRADLDAARRA